jgi:hypothetical protein
MVWIGAVVWGVLTGVPWIPVVVLVLIVLAVCAWLCAHTMRETKPGDDARIRFLGVLRIDLRRGLPPAETDANQSDNESPG